MTHAIMLEDGLIGECPGSFNSDSLQIFPIKNEIDPEKNPAGYIALKIFICSVCGASYVEYGTRRGIYMETDL